MIKQNPILLVRLIPVLLSCNLSLSYNNHSHVIAILPNLSAQTEDFPFLQFRPVLCALSMVH